MPFSNRPESEVRLQGREQGGPPQSRKIPTPRESGGWRSAEKIPGRTHAARQGREKDEETV